jgi:DNA/RNA-binding domain of Phe-tRNA-synthetase-like protein
MAFIVQDEIWCLFPGLRLVVAYAPDLDNATPRPAILQELRETEDRVKSERTYPNAQSHPYVDAWRQAFKRLGLSGKNFPSSIEALTRRVLSGGGVPDINPVVNLYNTISLRNSVPMGGWDVAGIAGGDVILKVTDREERFLELGTTTWTSVQAGEVSYADAREVITRHFVWRQSDTAKVTPNTRNVFFVSEVLPPAANTVCAAVRDELAAGLRTHFGVAANTAILGANCSRWEWE